MTILCDWTTLLSREGRHAWLSDVAEVGLTTVCECQNQVANLPNKPALHSTLSVLSGRDRDDYFVCLDYPP